MFDLAGISEGSLHAQRIMDLETEIASHHWDTVRSRDAVLTFNKKSFAEISTLLPPLIGIYGQIMRGSLVPSSILSLSPNLTSLRIWARSLQSLKSRSGARG